VPSGWHSSDFEREFELNLKAGDRVIVPGTVIRTFPMNSAHPEQVSLQTPNGSYIYTLASNVVRVETEQDDAADDPFVPQEPKQKRRGRPPKVAA
jgi:hypothetical protein